MESRFNSTSHKLKTELILETARRRKNQDLVLNILSEPDQPTSSTQGSQMSQIKA